MLVTLPQLNEMLPGIISGQSQVQFWDTRADEYYADGQMPGHIHISFIKLLDENVTFKPKEEIRDPDRERTGPEPPCDNDVHERHCVLNLLPAFGLHRESRHQDVRRQLAGVHNRPASR